MLLERQDDVSVVIQLAKEKRLKGLIFLGGQMDSLDNRLEETGVPYVLCTVAVNMWHQKEIVHLYQLMTKRKAIEQLIIYVKKAIRKSQ